MCTISLYSPPPLCRCCGVPAVSLQGVVSTGEIQPYEMIEMGDHEYEEVSKFQQSSGGEYEVVRVPSAGYENRAAIMDTKHITTPSTTLTTGDSGCGG